MHRLKLIALMIEPSTFSGIAVFLLASLIIIAANFSYLLRSGLFYDALYGKGSPVDLIQTSRTSFGAINQTVLGNPTLNKVLFFAFWMMIGLFVYATITTFGQSVVETEEELHSIAYVHARKQLIKRNIVLHVAVRLGCLVITLLYTWLFWRLLMPFCILSSRVGLSSLSNVFGWIYLALGITVMVMSLHAFVIMGRLVALRPRIFGEWDSL